MSEDKPIKCVEYSVHLWPKFWESAGSLSCRVDYGSKKKIKREWAESFLGGKFRKIAFLRRVEFYHYCPCCGEMINT